MAEQRLSEWKEWPLDLTAMLAALHRRQVEFVVIGGFAALVHGLPLATFDLDVVVAPGVDNTNRLLAAMSDMDALALVDDAEDAAPTPVEEALAGGVDVSFFTPHGYLDVVASPAAIGEYRGWRRGSHLVEVADGVEVRVAALRDIIASKLVAGRERDLAKIPALKTVAELAELRPRTPKETNRAASPAA